MKLCTFITPPKTLLAVSGGKTVLRVKVGSSIFEGCPLLSRDVKELYNAHDTAVKLPTVIKAGAVASEAAERLWPIAKLPEPGELEPCDQLHPNCCDALGYFMQLNQKIVTTAAFVQPDAITCFSQPSSSTIITASAFKGCVNLLMVTFSENLKIIGDKAFAECKSLRALYFPGSLREIGDSAFEGCLNLSSLHCQPSKKKAMQYFGVNVFKGCDALPPAAKHGWEDGHVVPADFYSCNADAKGVSAYLKDSGSVLKAAAFKGLALKSIVIPGCVTSIKTAAFQNCLHLKRVQFPPHLKTIGVGAFADCKSLVEATLPGSVEHIKDSAFAGCSSLSTLVILRRTIKKHHGRNTPSSGGCGCSSDNVECGGACGASPFSGDGDDVFGPLGSGGAAVISTTAFQECSGLRVVSVPDAVVESLGHPFQYAAALQSLPFQARCCAYQLQLDTYFWNSKLHRNLQQTKSNCKLALEQVDWVKSLLIIWSRMVALKCYATGGLQHIQGGSHGKQPSLLPALPNGICVLILTFVDTSMLGCA